MATNGSAVYVYYNRDNYAGFLRRLLIAVVDICVIVGLLFFLTFVFTLLFGSTRLSMQVSFFCLCILAYIYLVLLKRSVGTLGYLLMGVKIVDLTGGRPSILRMTGRFLWLFTLPLSLCFDLIWMTGEETRQTVRDKTVGTYVIKKKAVPAGTGQLQLKVISVLSLCLRYREVEKCDVYAFIPITY
ncbi:MAG: RDD family protein [Bacteroidales bacterium]|nr:RDD family protein [Bacteroidales bacterium]